jgi:hypothetical protein
VSAAITQSVAPSERRSQVITWFLGVGFLTLVTAYAAIGIYALLVPPLDGAWTIVTNAQKDLKEILLIVVGILGGAVTQRHV